MISNRPHAARDAQPAKELSTDEALDADAVQAHARMGNLDLGRSLPVLNHAAETNAQNHNSVALSMDSSVRTLHWGYRASFISFVIACSAGSVLERRHKKQSLVFSSSKGDG